MARTQTETNSRLSVDDWIQAGFAILAEEGIKALKIDRLCRRLGVTKGSFYWHSPTSRDTAPPSFRRGASCATTTADISASLPRFHRVNASRK
jgi:Bacterial regulatory proteins, tetR family